MSLFTKILRPWRVKEICNFRDIPDISRGPLYPLYLSLFFRIFGANDSSARIAVLTLHALLMTSTIVCSLSFHHPLLIAIVLLSIFLNGVLLKWGVLGYSESLGALFVALTWLSSLPIFQIVMLSLLVLWKPTHLLIGLYFLPHLQLSFLLIPIPFLIWTISRRIVTGSWSNEGTMIIYFSTILCKSEQLYWQYSTAQRPKFQVLFRIVGLKMWKNTLKLGKKCLLEFGEWMIICFLLAPYALAIFILLIIVHALFHSYERYMVPGFLLLVLAGTSKLPSGYWKEITAIVIIITLIRYSVHLVKDSKMVDFRLENLYQYQIQLLRHYKGVIVTDIPWATAWYADNLSIQLPDTMEDLEKIMEELQCKTIYFSPMSRWRVLVSSSWREVVETQPSSLMIGDFKFQQEFQFSSCGQWDGRGFGMLYTLSKGGEQHATS
jgi:hypothetical protein